MVSSKGCMNAEHMDASCRDLIDIHATFLSDQRHEGRIVFKKILVSELVSELLCIIQQRRRKAQEEEKVPAGGQTVSLVARRPTSAPPAGQARSVAAPQRVPLRSGQLQGEDKEGQEAAAKARHREEEQNEAIEAEAPSSEATASIRWRSHQEAKEVRSEGWLGWVE